MTYKCNKLCELTQNGELSRNKPLLTHFTIFWWRSSHTLLTHSLTCCYYSALLIMHSRQGNMFTWYKDPSAEPPSRQGFPLRDAYEINDATSMSATKRKNEIKEWMCEEGEGQEKNLTSCIFVAACSPSHYDADNFVVRVHCMAFIYCSCRSSAAYHSLPLFIPFFSIYGC